MIFTQALVVLFASLSASVSARATPVSGDAASMVERDAGVALVAWPARALPDHLARRKVERGTDLTNGERMKRGLPPAAPRNRKRFANAPNAAAAEVSGGTKTYGILYCSAGAGGTVTNFVAQSAQGAADTCASYAATSGSDQYFSIARSGGTTYPATIECTYAVTSFGGPQTCNENNAVIYTKNP